MKGVLEGIRVPEFELSHNSLDQSRILAVMYFPNDESLRRAYYSVCLAEHELTEAKEDREMAVSADLLEDLISAPSQQDLLRQSRKQGKRGMIAGDVLLAVYAMYSFPKYFPEPSIRSAIFVAQRFANDTEFEDKTELPSSEKAIRDHFNEFRTVARIGHTRTCSLAQTQSKISLAARGHSRILVALSCQRELSLSAQYLIQTRSGAFRRQFHGGTRLGRSRLSGS